MDDSRFDGLSKSVATATGRRTAAKLLAGSALGALGLTASIFETDANHRCRHRCQQKETELQRDRCRRRCRRRDRGGDGDGDDNDDRRRGAECERDGQCRSNCCKGDVCRRTERCD